jgi:subtilase family serine protease
LRIIASIGLFDKTQSQTLQALLSGLYHPSSSLYHQFLTSSQYSDVFAPSSTDYGSAVSYFQSYGLTTYTTQSRLFINLEGTAAQFSSALNTHLQLFTYNGLTFYENAVPLSLPQNIAQYTTSIIGMENFTFYIPYHIIKQVNPSSPIPPFAPPYQPSALEGAYNETGLLNNGITGAGQTIVLVDAGYGDKFIQADHSEFSLTYSLPNSIVSIQTVNSSNTIQDVQLDTLNGIQAQPPGLGVTAGWDVETALDVEWSHAMAPGANLVNMISFDPGVGLDQAVATAIVNHSGNIISQSFGQWEGFSNITYTGGPPNQTDAGYVDPFYQMAAATGITVLASSGDSGSTAQPGAPSPSVSWPASDPWVTAVGGTSIKISSAGFWQSETAWTGSGGGYSTSYTRPSFQTGPGLPVSGQYGNARGVPDIGADADPNTGVVFVVNGVNYGVAFSLGGTSLASPLWAGVIATLESFKNTNFGFYTPRAYSILNSPSYKAPVQDITSGSNGSTLQETAGTRSPASARPMLDASHTPATQQPIPLSESHRPRVALSLAQQVQL